MPASAGGIARSWISKGLMMPRASRATASSALTPSAANVFCDMRLLCWVVRLETYDLRARKESNEADLTGGPDGLPYGVR